jgi:ribosomal 50S subunit-associated protein YjgA (DUF615 family)
MHTRLKLFAALVFTSSLIGANIIARADTAPPVSPPPGPVPAVAPDRGELKAMDAFLDTHSVIDDELREHPALADNPDFIKDHPEYAAFLAGHPGVAGQLKEHPRYFVYRSLERQRRQPITAGEVQTLDAFLDAHPGIDKELSDHPRLADDPKYIEGHPELHEFLNHHPGADAALESKPVRTMEKEEKTDQPAFHEIKDLDGFLDEHPVIDDLLREHPALADNPDFIKDHPEYAAFLTAHPGVAGQLKDHPRYFMHRALELQRDQPITPAEVKTLDAFLDRHPDIDKALVANPKIIDDPKFIEAHPELHDFLKDHPRVAGVLISKPHKTIRRVVHHEHHERPKVP